MKRLLLLALTIFLVACGKSPEPGDTSKISKGMSEDEVTELLGKPDFQTTDREELETTYDGLSSLYAVDLEFKDDMSGWEEVGEFLDAVEEKRNIKVYDYKLEDSSRINVYFLDGKVLYFYELDLASK